MTEIIENNMRLISDAPQAAASEAGLTRQCGLYYTLPRFLSFSLSGAPFSLMPVY